MADDLAPGLEEEQKYRSFGANDTQINEWKQQQIDDFRKHGADDKQINDYFGVKDPDSGPIKAYVKQNLQDFHESRKDADGAPPKEAATFGEALKAGWQDSNLGLATEGKLPDTVLPEHAGFMMRMASQAAHLAGDFPSMLAGGALGVMVGTGEGAAAGSVVPGAGTVGGALAGAGYGGMAGAFAAPAGIRRLLIDGYEKHGFKSAGDFAETLAGATWDAIKSGTVGALTAGAGAVGALRGTAMGMGAELATMTIAGAAMQGKLPEPQDFIDGAMMIGGFHAAGDILPTKLREIYAKTGARSEEVAQKAETDVVYKQDLLSDNSNLPPEAEKEPPSQDELDKALGGNAPTKEDLEGKAEVDKALTRRNDRGGPPSEPGSVSDDDVSKAVEKVNSHVGEKQEPDGLGVKDLLTPEGREKLKSAFITNMIDELHPINDAMNMASDSEGKYLKELPDSMNASMLAHSASGWQSKAESILNYNTMDFKTGKANGEGLVPILKDIGKNNMDEFRAFGMAKRALERADQGKPTGVDLKAAKVVVDAYQEHFGKQFDRLVSFQDRMMQYAVDGGILSKEAAARIRSGENSSQDYIPQSKEKALDPYGGTAKGSANQFQFMEGSDEKVKNFLDEVPKKMAAIVRQVEVNNVGRVFGDMIDQAPNGAAVGQWMSEPTGSKNEITFKRNGDLVAYKIEPRFADAIKSLGGDPATTNFLVKMIAAPASWLRTGTVLNPDFMLRHLGRAILTRAVQTGEVSAKDLLMNVAGSFRAIGHIWKEDSVWQSYLSSGAAQGDITSAMDRVAENFWGKQADGGDSVVKKMWNVPGSIKQGLEYASMVADNAARVAEFKNRAGSFDEQGNFQVGGKDQVVGAATAARQATLDYGQKGAALKAYTAVVPFMNIGIQGNYRMFQGLKADPLGYSAKAFAMITVPSLYTYFANHNDSRYQDAPNWEKDVYWLFPTDKWEPAANVSDAISRPDDMRRRLPDGSWEVNNGNTIRVMKPFELGILFGSLPERLLARYVGDNPRAMKEFASTALHGIVPNVLPTALTPVLEQATNYNFFTGRPVVSSHNEGLLPEYQYNEYTSTTAKAIGKLYSSLGIDTVLSKIGIDGIGPKNSRINSPQVIDNYIHDWTGTLGQYALQAIGGTSNLVGTSGGVQKPDWKLADYPVVKAFMARYPNAQAQPIQDFYDDYSAATVLNTTYQDLIKQGRGQEAMALQSASLGSMTRLNNFKSALSIQAKLLKQINEDEKMSGSDKRQLMDQTYYQMVITAKQGNMVMDQLKNSVKRAGE